MSIFDWFRSSSYESYLYRENVKLEDENKRLKKENKSVWQQLNAISRMQNIQMLDPCSLPDSKAFQVILSNEQRKNRMLECELNHAHEENRELKKKLNENRMSKTLEQYETDEKELICKNQDLEYQLFVMKCHLGKSDSNLINLNEELSKALNELKLYKEFFVNNQVNVVLKGEMRK